MGGGFKVKREPILLSGYWETLFFFLLHMVSRPASLGKKLFHPAIFPGVFTYLIFKLF